MALDEKAAASLLKRLKDVGEGNWQVLVPRQYTAFNRRILLRISTARALLGASVPPNSLEISLATSVIMGLATVIKIAEEKYLACCITHDPDPVPHARNPSIEIWRHLLEDKGRDQWTFIWERDDWEGGGIHVEFKGLSYVTHWGGD